MESLELVYDIRTIQIKMICSFIPLVLLVTHRMICMQYYNSNHNLHGNLLTPDTLQDWHTSDYQCSVIVKLAIYRAINKHRWMLCIRGHLVMSIAASFYGSFWLAKSGGILGQGDCKDQSCIFATGEKRESSDVLYAISIVLMTT